MPLPTWPILIMLMSLNASWGFLNLMSHTRTQVSKTCSCQSVRIGTVPLRSCRVYFIFSAQATRSHWMCDQAMHDSFLSVWQPLCAFVILTFKIRGWFSLRIFLKIDKQKLCITWLFFHFINIKCISSADSVRRIKVTMSTVISVPFNIWSITNLLTPLHQT